MTQPWKRGGGNPCRTRSKGTLTPSPDRKPSTAGGRSSISAKIGLWPVIDAKLVLALLGAKLFDRLVEAVPLGRESVAALCQACDQLIGLATVVSAKPTFERRRHRCK